MKVRKGFVSNSSSSSFLIAYRGEEHAKFPDLEQALCFKSGTLALYNSDQLVHAIIENIYDGVLGPDDDPYECLNMNNMTIVTTSNIDTLTARNKQIWEEDPNWQKGRDSPYDWHIERTLIESGFKVFYGEIADFGENGTAIENLVSKIDGYFASKNEIWIPNWEPTYIFERQSSKSNCARKYQDARNAVETAIGSLN